jgi:hypothetical protein
MFTPTPGGRINRGAGSRTPGTPEHRLALPGPPIDRRHGPRTPVWTHGVVVERCRIGPSSTTMPSVAPPATKGYLVGHTREPYDRVACRSGSVRTRIESAVGYAARKYKYCTYSTEHGTVESDLFRSNEPHDRVTRRATRRRPVGSSALAPEPVMRRRSTGARRTEPFDSREPRSRTTVVLGGLSTEYGRSVPFVGARCPHPVVGRCPRRGHSAM